MGQAAGVKPLRGVAEFRFASVAVRKRVSLRSPEPTMSTLPSNARTPERLVFLDWVRIGAFGLLVLYHTGMH